jgi:hypothetical protein
VGARRTKEREAELERAIAMRERGGLIREIAEAIGWSRKSLNNAFVELGVEPPNPPPLQSGRYLTCPVVIRDGRAVRAFAPSEDERLVDLRRTNLKYSAIGRILGREPGSIRKRLFTLARRDEREFSKSQSPTPRPKRKFVVGPDGLPLSLANLPRPGTKRWVPRRKAEIVAAVRGGLLTLKTALARYNLTHDELLDWMGAIDKGGIAQLRVTRLQQHRAAA